MYIAVYCELWFQSVGLTPLEKLPMNHSPWALLELQQLLDFALGYLSLKSLALSLALSLTFSVPFSSWVAYPSCGKGSMGDLSSCRGNNGNGGTSSECLGHGLQALWTPQRLQHVTEQQGWKGPPIHLFVGSVPEVLEFCDERILKPLAIQNFETVPRVNPPTISIFHWSKLTSSLTQYCNTPVTQKC